MLLFSLKKYITLAEKHKNFFVKKREGNTLKYFGLNVIFAQRTVVFILYDEMIKLVGWLLKPYRKKH